MNGTDFNRTRHSTQKKPERRFVTVLMCDISSSTHLSDTLSAEDFGGVIEQVISLFMDEIEYHQGYVSAYQGDSVIGLFGYPTAVESHPELAVTCALAIAGKMQTLEGANPRAISVRMGIASGTTLISPFFRPGSLANFSVFGYVPNLSARLQAIALPNAIFVDQTTYRLSQNAVHYSFVGHQKVKGFDHSVAVWNAMSLREQSVKPPITTHPFQSFGRIAEFRELERDIQNASRRQVTHTLLISGEAGIGKTHLVNLAMSRFMHEKHCVRLHCDQRSQNSPYHAFVPHLQQILQISDTFNPGDNEKLDRLMEGYPEEKDAVLPFMQLILGFKVIGSLEDSASVKACVEKIIVGSLVDNPAQDPLVFIEDLHWADNATIELLNHLPEQSPSITVVCTSRRTAPFHQLQIDREVTLAPLAEHNSLEMIHAIANDQLDAKTLQDIQISAGGMPLYIEEFVYNAISNGQTLPTRTSQREPLPVRLQFGLLSRLDSTGEAKSLASIAALIGREFDLEILSFTSGYTEQQIKQHITTLIDQNILSTNAQVDKAVFVFKHVLVQEASANLLTESEQVNLHAKIADYYQNKRPDGTRVMPQVVGYHYQKAARFDEALMCWWTAAELVSNTWAKLEAANYFQNALDCLVQTEGLSNHAEIEMELQAAKGDVLYAALGCATEESLNAFHRSIALARDLHDTATECRVLDGLFGIHFNSAHFEAAEDSCHQLIALSDQTGNLAQAMLGNQGLGMCLFNRGKLRHARTQLQQTLQYQESPVAIISDFPSMANLYLSWSLQIIGETEEASTCYATGLRQARQGTPYNVAAALGNGCHLYQFQNRPDKLAQCVEELIELCEANGYSMWGQLGHFFTGWLDVIRGRSDSGVAQLRNVFDSLEDDVEKSYYLGLIGKAELQRGNLDKAKSAIEKGLQMAEKNHEHYYTAELMRVRATIQRLNNDLHTSRSTLDKAHSLALQQGAGLWLQSIEEERTHQLDSSQCKS